MQNRSIFAELDLNSAAKYRHVDLNFHFDYIFCCLTFLRERLLKIAIVQYGATRRDQCPFILNKIKKTKKT